MSYSQFGGGASYEQSMGGGGGFQSQQQVGGGGGGFLSPSQGGFDNTNMSASQMQSAGGGKRKDNQSVLPVTIKQLQEAVINDDQKYRIDDHEVAQVTFVACILSIDAKATNVSYHMTDCTGEIHVKLYLDSDDGAMNSDVLTAKTRGKQIVENQYVRVIGNPRVMNDQRNIIAFQLIPIEDHNEITMHNLDVIMSHLKHSRGPPGQQQQQQQMMQQQQQGLNPMMPGGMQQPQMQQGMNQMGGHVKAEYANNGAHQFQPVQAAAGLAAGGNSQFTPFQVQVLQHFASDTSDAGASVLECINKLSSQVSAVEVRSTVEWLSEEGHLYSTIDEDHYKNTVMP